METDKRCTECKGSGCEDCAGTGTNELAIMWEMQMRMMRFRTCPECDGMGCYTCDRSGLCREE